MIFNDVVWFLGPTKFSIVLQQEDKARMIQTLLFVAGVNTLFQTLFGTRLPVVIGGSYTFVPTTISIILASRYDNILNPQEVGSLHCYAFFVMSSSLFIWLVINMQRFQRIMRGTQGALIVASTLQIVLGFSGLWRNVVRLVPVLILELFFLLHLVVTLCMQYLILLGVKTSKMFLFYLFGTWASSNSFLSVLILPSFDNSQFVIIINCNR